MASTLVATFRFRYASLIPPHLAPLSFPPWPGSMITVVYLPAIAVVAHAKSMKIESKPLIIKKLYPLIFHWGSNFLEINKIIKSVINFL